MLTLDSYSTIETSKMSVASTVIRKTTISARMSIDPRSLSNDVQDGRRLDGSIR